jgi:hypothetical protein
VIVKTCRRPTSAPRHDQRSHVRLQHIPVTPASRKRRDSSTPTRRHRQ